MHGFTLWFRALDQLNGWPRSRLFTYLPKKEVRKTAQGQDQGGTND